MRLSAFEGQVKGEEDLRESKSGEERRLDGYRGSITPI